MYQNHINNVFLCNYLLTLVRLKLFHIEFEKNNAIYCLNV